MTRRMLSVPLPASSESTCRMIGGLSLMAMLIVQPSGVVFHCLRYRVRSSVSDETLKKIVIVAGVVPERSAVIGASLLTGGLKPLPVISRLLAGEWMLNWSPASWGAGAAGLKNVNWERTNPTVDRSSSWGAGRAF